MSSLVFHDQSKDISAGIEHLKRQVVEAGFDQEHAIHCSPLIRREEDYRCLDVLERRKMSSSQGISKSEEDFFRGQRNLKENYLRSIERKRL